MQNSQCLPVYREVKPLYTSLNGSVSALDCACLSRSQGDAVQKPSLFASACLYALALLLRTSPDHSVLELDGFYSLV